MAGHVTLLVVFAACVSTTFAVLMRDALDEQLRLGGQIFAAFVLAGLGLGWLMWPFP